MFAFMRTLAVLAVAVAVPAFATSFVTVPDPQLAAEADAIVVGRVVAAHGGAHATRPVTQYTIEIEELLQGQIAVKNITVTVPGGIAKNGRGLVVHGAPHFDAGERTILFLVRDGEAFAPLHLMLGAFREQRSGSFRLAMRDLSGATEIGDARDEHRPRDFERFAAWLRDTSRPREYFVDLPRPRFQVAPFTLFDVEGYAMRWFDFQWDGSVSFRVHELDGSDIDDRNVPNVARALAVWSENAGTTIDYRYAGRTSARGGFTENDAQHTVLFGDPNNDIPGKYRCITGGVLAIGGGWFETDLRFRWRGKEAIAMMEADVVVNDGIECMLNRPHADLELQEVLAHEIGHTLGLGHSCGDPNPCDDPKLDEALMRAFIHGGERGPALAEDDRLAAKALYETIGPRLGISVQREFVYPGEAMRFAPTRRPEGVTYAWDFGDGSAESGEVAPSHVYAKPGIYTVRLRATDASGTNEILRLVQVANKKQRAARH